jgi:hypothetical protein
VLNPFPVYPNLFAFEFKTNQNPILLHLYFLQPAETQPEDLCSWPVTNPSDGKLEVFVILYALMH